MQFDLITNKLVQSIQLPDEFIEVAAFSPDGTKLAYGGRKKEWLKLWM